jgi:hypothetical protein
MLNIYVSEASGDPRIYSSIGERRRTFTTAWRPKAESALFGARTT